MMTIHATVRYLERVCGERHGDAVALAPALRDAACSDLMRSRAICAALAATRGTERQITVTTPKMGRVVVRSGRIITVLHRAHDMQGYGRTGAAGKFIRGRAS